MIHAVGPIWRGGRENEIETLEFSILESLRVGESININSISFPAISSGIFGFPK